MTISGRTKLIAHLGYPTESFKAPMIYNPYFEKHNIDAVVVPMGCKGEDYAAFLKLVFKLSNIHGALVTMPHKVTTVPLLLFAAAARRIPLSLMGMLQYINPTIQFLLGVFLYKEPFSRGQFVGFAFVWAALVLFAGEGYVAISSSADHANNSGGSDGPEENRGSTY